METKIGSVLAFSLNPIAYFGIIYFMTNYFIEYRKQGALTGEFVVVIAPGLLLLWAITYMGVWICIAGRDSRKFKKFLFLLDFCPATIGFIAAVLGSFL